ncbi:MAG TPA: rhodanese-like domain-containing protein [Bacteroidia bacterium]|nr:rhodanese-like domain-containing protein [Bacteroidia bacterium]
MKEITVQELKRMKDSGEKFQLIDVREPHEAEIASIGGELIPMGEILSQAERLAKDIPVVVHCRSGARSASVIQALEKQGFSNLLNLKGGILAWAKEIDTSLSTY